MLLQLLLEPDELLPGSCMLMLRLLQAWQAGLFRWTLRYPFLQHIQRVSVLINLVLESFNTIRGPPFDTYFDDADITLSLFIFSGTALRLDKILNPHFGKLPAKLRLVPVFIICKLAGILSARIDFQGTKALDVNIRLLEQKLLSLSTCRDAIHHHAFARLEIPGKAGSKGLFFYLYFINLFLQSFKLFKACRVHELTLLQGGLGSKIKPQLLGFFQVQIGRASCRERLSWLGV